MLVKLNKMPKKKKMPKLKQNIPDTSRGVQKTAMPTFKDLKVDESIKKDKIVKEKDVFNFSSKT
jgi:hypothetical protein